MKKDRERKTSVTIHGTTISTEINVVPVPNQFNKSAVRLTVNVSSNNDGYINVLYDWEKNQILGEEINSTWGFHSESKRSRSQMFLIYNFENVMNEVISMRDAAITTFDIRIKKQMEEEEMMQMLYGDK